jgi:hypothetical protein
MKRDNGSFKYALCSVGKGKSSRVKFSETPGKSTLGGPFKLLRDSDALKHGRTIVLWNEDGEDVRKVYYNGLNETFFGDIMFEDNIDIKARIKEQLAKMPKRLIRDIPVSETVHNIRLEELKKHAPDKLDFFKNV